MDFLLKFYAATSWNSIIHQTEKLIKYKVLVENKSLQEIENLKKEIIEYLLDTENMLENTIKNISKMIILNEALENIKT